MGPGSMHLARIWGIRIGLNASWFLVLFLFVFLLSESFTSKLGGDTTAGYATAVAAALLFFGSILLHELGHALAARREGIAVSGIVLFFFGGLMRMNRDTDSPGAEFRVAVAGPLVTAALIALGMLVGIGLAGSFEALLSAATLEEGDRASAPELLVAFLVSMNVALLVLNLVPAFPLDGGRIARAAAWKLTGSRIKATRISAWLGQAFAVVLIGWGIVLASMGALVNGLWLIVLGWMLGQSARTAVAQTAFSERLRQVTVAEVMDSEPVTIPAGTSALRAWEDFFLRYQGWQWFPVVDADGRPAGIAHREEVEEAARGQDAGAPVESVASAAEQEGTVGQDEPLEVLVGSPALRQRGALLALDGQGRVRGVVTLRQVSRALSSQMAGAA